MQEVFPPYLTVLGPGTGIEPLTPQKTSFIPSLHSSRLWGRPQDTPRRRAKSTPPRGIAFRLYCYSAYTTTPAFSRGDQKYLKSGPKPSPGALYPPPSLQTGVHATGLSLPQGTGNSKFKARSRLDKLFHLASFAAPRKGPKGQIRSPYHSPRLESRFSSFALIASRLSWALFPRARAISTLIFPLGLK